jgi:hypothetical protein
LKRCRKKKALLEALEALPQTLDETYERILTHIEKDYQKEARRALIWLAFSQRPLNIEELAEAAVVDSNLSPPFDPEERLHDPCNDIIEILGSLVTTSSKRVANHAWHFSWNSDLDVTSNRPDISLADLGCREIRLAHFSVKEYLLSDRITSSPAPEFKATSLEANQFISESCLLYIFHYDKSNFRTMSPADLKYFPLLQYACEFWYMHTISTSARSQKSMDPVNFRLFLSDTALTAWLQVHRPDKLINRPFSVSEEVGSPLYYASWIGLTTAVQLLLGHKVDIDAKDSDG